MQIICMINKNGSMGNRFFLFCSFILLACFSVQAQVSFGEAKKFNENWLFSLSDDSLGASVSYNDSKWRKLDLPHDWSVEGLMLRQTDRIWKIETQRF